MLGPTPAEGFLAWAGLPNDYPHGDQLAKELDDELFTAAELVLADWKRQDPLLRVMMHDDCELRRWVPMLASDVLYGTRICVEVKNYCVDTRRHFGRVRPENPTDGHRYADDARVYVKWEWNGEEPPRLRAEDLVDAYVPVPFDLGALLAEIDGRPHVVPPLTGRAPTLGQWSALNHAIRCYSGKVYRPRGKAGGSDRRPGLRRRGWIDDTDMVTTEGRRVHAAYNYDTETGKLTEGTSV